MLNFHTLFSLVLLSGCQDDKEDAPKKATSLSTNDTATSEQQGPYGLPLENPGDFNTPVIGMDHDPTDYPDGAQSLICKNYNGDSWCYDGHEGSDFMLDGGFDKMDAGSSEIIAAANGKVVEIADGNYDRCHFDLDEGEVTCDGYAMKPNYVTLLHDDGYLTRYLHMKKDSIEVEVGDEVECGDILGLVGSSGHSSAPHLHFDVTNPEGEFVDPYAGEYSQAESYWIEQGEPEDLPAKKCP